MIKIKRKVFKNLFGKDYDYTNKNNLEIYQDMCSIVYRNGGLESLFNYLQSLLTTLFPNIEPPFTEEDTKKERILLDACIEEYTFLYFLHKGQPNKYIISKESKEVEEMLQDKLWRLLMDYKMEKYGNEIMEKLGLELIGKVEQGYIVRDKDDTGIIQ